MLVEKLGGGGMGTVYKARHALLRRPTAIKLLKPETLSESAILRFEREVQLTSELTHPNTVSVYDFGRTPEGTFYYAMEYLEGVTLGDLVRRHGPLPEARTLHILRQICASLSEAHAVGLIHRDIKPSNIILTQRGGQYDFVKVLDFGLAKWADSHGSDALTATNAVSGTPLYVSPEAVTNPRQVDARADVYEIGAVGWLDPVTPAERAKRVDRPDRETSGTRPPNGRQPGTPCGRSVGATELNFNGRTGFSHRGRRRSTRGVSGSGISWPA